MSAHTTLNEAVMAELSAPDKGNKVHYFSGVSLRGKKAPSGFGVRITAAGAKSFVWFHRVDGRKYLETIGSWRGNKGGGQLDVLTAIEKAGERAKLVTKGVDKKGNDVDARPLRTRRLEQGDADKTINDLLDQWEKHHLSTLRSADQIKSALTRLVRPNIGGRSVYAIKPTHIGDMLRTIAAGKRPEGGKVAAGRALAYVRSAFNWYAAEGHDDDFVNPIPKKMGRNYKANARERVLDKEELRDVWSALDEADVPEAYRRYIRGLLLTSLRRNELAALHGREIEVRNLQHGDLIVIPSTRYKTKTAHVLPITEDIMELIKPIKDRFLFSTSGGTKPISGFNKFKTALDRAVAKRRIESGRGEMENWTLHDLRRTARVLMAEAGVRREYIERVLGHAILGVEKVYDRYDYITEKRSALKALASIVNTIISAQPSNVVALTSSR